jgi:mandelate racemase
VRSRTGARIQTGENWMSTGAMQRAIAAGACDYAMPGLQRIGGVSAWLKAAALAESAGLPISSHVFVEASAHLMAAAPTAHWLEHLEIAGPILRDPVTVAKDGTICAKGPGIGLEWDEAAVLRHAA